MSHPRLGAVSGRGAALVAVLIGSAACGYSGGRGLPSVFPLTHGASPLPANGIGAGAELGEGLRRPDPLRADVLTMFLAGGIANRISGSWATFEGRTPDDVRGNLLRLKLRLGGAFGPGTGFQVSYAHIDRSLFGGPHDKLRSVDFAAPAEFVVTGERATVQLRAIFGPRVTVEHYTDLLDARRSAHVLYLGALGGARLSLGDLHLFAEATLTRMPQAPGESWSYHAVILPTIGLLFGGGPSAPRRNVP